MIMRIFFLAGSLIGVSGTLGGGLLGLGFALNIETIRQWIQTFTGTNVFNSEIYFLSQLPAKVDPGSGNRRHNSFNTGVSVHHYSIPPCRPSRSGRGLAL